MARIIHWRQVAPRGEYFHAARDAKTPRNPLRYHGHDFAEVFWIDAGRGEHVINDLRVPLAIGDLVLMRPTDFHGIQPGAGEQLRLTNIAFPRETWEWLGERYFPGKAEAFWAAGAEPETRRLEPARLARLNRWADALAHAPQGRLAIERFLLNLLTELAPAAADALPAEAPDWLLHACREASARPEYLAAGQAAFVRLAGRSREHVARTLRQVLGVSPTEFMNAARMDYAARQLEMSDRPIVEIALDCGLENLSHFYALFRAKHGTTPRQYRLAHRAPL